MSKFSQYFHPNSKQVDYEGNEVDGKKEGLWTWYYESGAVKSKGSYTNDIADGHFYYYHENGEESANGSYEGEDKVGPWVWHHEDGAVNQYGTFVAGKLEGPYYWFHATGEPSTTGGFRKGERDGYWTWQNTAGALIHEVTYVSGKVDVVERKFSGDGKRLVFEKYYDKGVLHGDFVVNNEDGSPVEKAHYIKGVLHGEYLKWENGKKKKKIFEHGVPMLTEKRWKSLASQINKKRSHYAKIDVLDKVVEYSAKIRTLWYLFKAGYLDFGAHPDLWSEMSTDFSSVNSNELLVLLKGLKLTKEQIKATSNFLPFWPMALDKMCMHFYANNPEPFDAPKEGYSNNVLEGIKLVQLRFGRIDKVSLTKDLAKELAIEHLYHYGIGLSGGGVDGAYSTIWWQEDGIVKKLNVSDKERSGLSNEAFYEMIDLFTTKEAWQKALLKEALTFERNLPMPYAVDAIKSANLKEFIILYKAFSTSIYDDFYWALIDLRKNSLEDLEFLIKAVKKDNRPGERAECATVVAILKRAEQGLEIPEWYDTFINFDAYYATKNSYGNYLTGIDHQIKALECLDENRLNCLLKRQIEDDYYWMQCFPFLYLSSDISLRNLAVDKLAEKQSKDLIFSSLAPVYLGLAKIGTEGMNWLMQKIETADQPHIHQLLTLTMVGLMAELGDKGETWDASYDKYLRLDYWKPRYGDDYDYYICKFMQKAVWALPEVRQTNVLTRNLDASSSTFIRVFSLFNQQTSDTVLYGAMDILAHHKINKPGENWIYKTLGGALKEKSEGLIEYCMEQGAKGEVLDWFNTIIGSEKIQAIGVKLSQKGKKVAKQLTQTEQLQELLTAYFNKYPDTAKTELYYLEPNRDAKVEANDLNRIGGPAIGVDATSIPKYEGELMDHLFTLDVNTLTPLKEQLPKDTVALAVFVANPDYNEAWSPGTEESKVLFLTKEDVSKGVFVADYYEPYSRSEGVLVQKIVVPAVIFHASNQQNSKNEEQVNSLAAIKKKVYNAPAYVLGEPIWLQEEAYYGNFLMQFDAKFCSVNLGDVGVMYVFDDTAFWQSH